MPFQGYGNDIQVLMSVQNGIRPKIPHASSRIEQELWKLVERCWDQKPVARPSIKEVMTQVCIDLLILHGQLKLLSNVVG